MNMRRWVAGQIAACAKEPVPILSYPLAAHMGIGARELVTDAGKQARVLMAAAERFPVAAVIGCMDLTVEAEALGARVVFSDARPPVIAEAPEGLCVRDVPEAGAGRTGIFVEAVGRASALIADRPVLAAVTGPFTLAGGLLGYRRARTACADEPALVHAALRRASRFLHGYIGALRDAGADGVLLAEPLAGLLSAAQNREFSAPYLRELIRERQDESFAAFYHNCGGNIPELLEDIVRTGAAGLHFGNAVDIARLLPDVPADIPVLGNIDPAGVLRDAEPGAVAEAVGRLRAQCAGHPNFILSSGCDVPADAPMENLRAFFEAGTAARPEARRRE